MDGDWAASALKWWEEAGVDTLVDETPRNWLAGEKKAASSGLSPHPPARSASGPLHQPGGPTPGGSFGSGLIPQGEREITLPDTLEAFQAWLLEGEVPLATPAMPRIGPVGDPASGLMIFVDMPSTDDVAAGVLLSGEAGALFDRMMSAIGRGRDSLYLAPLSPVRTATGSFDAVAAPRLAEVARHHIGLVSPRAVLLFGDACAKVLLGAPVAETRGKWHELELPQGKVSTLVTIRPEKLERSPGLKKLAWEDLKMLREGLEK